MTKFIYRFEKLLNIRRFERENLEYELASLRGELINEKNYLKQLYLKHREYSDLLKDLTKGEMDIAQIQDYSNYLDSLFEDIDVQKKVINQLKNQVDKKIEEVVEATKKVKILEKLKEKRFKDFQKDEEDREQKVLDEIGKNQFLRRQTY